MEFVNRVIAGTLGGFVGGALAGLGEAATIAAFGGAEEFGAFFFAALAYGLFGAAVGGGWALAASIVPFLGAEAGAVLGTGGGLAIAALGFVVSRFRVTRDVFGESLPIASATGILVHLLLLGLAVALFIAVRRSLTRAAGSRGATAAGLRWALGCVATAAVLTVALNAVLAGGGDETFPSGTAQGANVILIIADTLRPDYTGPYGAQTVSTPALDRLAADGVVFDRTFAHSSWTRPSIATILTSLYAASHTVMHKTDLLPEDVVTLAEAMQEGGYRTSGFVTNINVAPSFGFDQGFQEYSYLAPEFFFGATDSASKLSLYSGMRLIRERFLSSKKWVRNYYQDAETVNSGALPWLDANARQPFFTLIHYMDPHDPYFEIPYNGVAVARVDTPNPDPSQSGRLEKLYASNIEYMDGFLARLFAELDDAGLYDDTVIAFTADHGEEFFEHGGWWHGTTLYEEQIHVPLIVKLPGNDKAGKRVGGLSGLIDVAPTLLGVAGVPVPPTYQGRDLFGQGQSPKALYAEEDHEGNVLESIRTERWKLVLANEGNPRGLANEELYDLEKDPGETNNVAATQSDRVAALKADMEALRGAAALGAVTAESGELDEAAKERLRALGYLE